MKQANMRPADELKWIRDQIKELKDREEILRNKFLDGEADEDGDNCIVFVEKKSQQRLDRVELVKALGSLKQFMKQIEFWVVKTIPKDQA